MTTGPRMYASRRSLSVCHPIKCRPSSSCLQGSNRPCDWRWNYRLQYVLPLTVDSRSRVISITIIRNQVILPALSTLSVLQDEVGFVARSLGRNNYLRLFDPIRAARDTCERARRIPTEVSHRALSRRDAMGARRREMGSEKGKISFFIEE